MFTNSGDLLFILRMLILDAEAAAGVKQEGITAALALLITGTECRYEAALSGKLRR
jgi:hypothetical protein